VQRASYQHFASAAYHLPSVHGFKPDDVMPNLAILEKAMIESGDATELKTYLHDNYLFLQQ
jgi:hypothetical protein